MKYIAGQVIFRLALRFLYSKLFCFCFCCVFRLGAFLRHFFSAVEEYAAYSHDDCEYYEISETWHTMLVYTGSDHYDGAEYRKYGKNKALPCVFALCLFHPHDEYRQIHGIDGDYRKLGGVESEDTAPCACEICKIEVCTPYGTDRKTDNSRVIGHICFAVYLRENLMRGTLLSCRYGIYAARGSEHKTVQRAEAGDGDKEIEQISEETAENIFECDGSAFFNKFGI